MDKRLKIEDWLTIEEKLRAALNPVRYQHTLGVTYTAAALAMKYGLDVGKARLAGLLHDCAKCIPDDEKIRMCRENPVEVTEFELEHPYLLHSKLGAFVAQAEYGVTDEEILSAIRWHTTGKPEMTVLEQIIYISDSIEPNRDDELPDLRDVRILAFTDLDECCVQIMHDNIAHIKARGLPMDSMTEKAYNYYKEKVSSRKKTER
ncbi:MAG: bis(5'-nucleosyl)-tetraphosphatase (symmetrical) YqeK [Eubacterium sp.]|nr:bis(5'-nucleosyl)-tetraphosphatase (symmetrical) YqeK [Eubacterium sp.]